MAATNIPDSLAGLALDLRWSWNHSADQLWGQIDPELWNLTHNAWLVLQTVSKPKLDAALADPAFRKKLDEVMANRKDAAESSRWFPSAWPRAKMSAVAYFSMEFMLSDALPVFSGGLGNVAGDHLKAANDLGVPVIGVGLLYQQGYFRQHIDSDGNQIALRPFNEPGQLPVRPLRDSSGEWLRISIQLPGYLLSVRTWEVQVGRTKLYLMDTNDPANLPEYRGITSELYGGGPELRLQQERILGVGGWRLLRALGIRPEVCHLNEGHATFAVLERARSYREDTGRPFAEALAVTRAGNLFTTHTPVAAGFDRFAPELMRDRMRDYAERELGISLHELMALGRNNPADESEPFNMAYLGVRGSGAVNGVSRLHGAVSRRIFQPLFPRWPSGEVPVGYVTNGIHTPTWDSPEADELWTEVCGKDRWRGDLTAVDQKIRDADEKKFWQMRQRARRSLIQYVRQRLSRQLAGHGAPAQEIAEAEAIFDPDTLTLGFARRFATYKRPNLLLHDRERLLRLLTNRHRPVQLVIAGKAHPQDSAGQGMIREWIEFIRRTSARPHVVFLSDDDMGLTEHLVQGVDLWLNTPRRPWEASGTSGMKVLVNGGLNLSELDGWWAEAYTSEVGWALGDGLEHEDEAAVDAADASQLYTLLENEIVPEFYDRDPAGIPGAWVGRMRESMARLTPQFSTNRVVREYTEQHYLPLASGFLERSKDNGAPGVRILEWQKHLEEHWPRLRFGTLCASTDGGQHTFAVQVWLDELNPDAIAVELYADGDSPVLHEMTRGAELIGSGSAWTWTATIPADRPAGDFTPRVVPRHPGASVPLESQKILWYR
ncbi:MAG TPA: alpha-glucan family phosphorylase [Bryobacteraceae bacterium]|jgi:starch phosphorylase|nr:alpha-glucan family phosphorylase [Bryobacteraceae bacterium]